MFGWIIGKIYIQKVHSMLYLWTEYKLELGYTNINCK